MDNDIKDKRPETEDGERDGGWYWSVEFHVRALGGVEILVAKIDEETSMPRAMWGLPVHPEAAPSDHAALVAFVQERGIFMGDLTQGTMTDKAKEWSDEYRKSLLSKGDQVPCECCGAATGGKPFPSGLVADDELRQRIIDELHKPDPAGRIWWNDDLGAVAVCDDPRCWATYFNHEDQLLAALKAAKAPESDDPAPR